MSKERIIAAAVYDGVIVSLPPPARHGDIMYSMSDGVIMPQHQGFITNTGRFVNRIEAAGVAYRSGQCTELSAPPNLYSEDLW